MTTQYTLRNAVMSSPKYEFSGHTIKKSLDLSQKEYYISRTVLTEHNRQKNVCSEVVMLTKTYEATVATAQEKVVSRDLIVLSSTFFFIFLGAASFQQYLIPYTVRQTGQSHATCSWILASVYLSSIVWRILYPYTLEWIGTRGAIVGGFLTYTLFAVVALLSKSYPLLLISALIWGWGAAAIWITGPSQILESTSALRYGRASGIFYSAVYAGQGLGVYLLG